MVPPYGSLHISVWPPLVTIPVYCDAAHELDDKGGLIPYLPIFEGYLI